MRKSRQFIYIVPTVTMPPEQMEAPDKPFPVEAKDKQLQEKNGGSGGEPSSQGGQPSDSAFRAMGLTKPADTTPPAKTPPDKKELTPQEKSEQEGKEVVDTYSGKIQAVSEELYTTLAARARHEEGFFDKLVASEDPVDQKMAKKILERNADVFGASTVEDYLAKKQIEAAGDDPVRQELAQVKINQASLDKKLKDAEWKAWKAENAVSPELGELADQIRKNYPPETPYGDIVHIARGRLGITTPAPATKPGTSMPSGQGGRNDAGAPVDASVQKIMKTDDPALAKRAEKYFSQFDN